MKIPKYDVLTAEYKRSLETGEPLPRERYTVSIHAEGRDAPAREFEWVGVVLRGWGPRIFALDPELDPRKAVRVDGLRGVSLSNFLNHVVALARPGGPTGKGSYRWIPVRTAGALPHGLDTQVDLERQGVALVHDFLPENPERDVGRAQAAVTEFTLLWLRPGWVLSGRVFNFEPNLGKGSEGHFVSLQAPKAYGDAARLPWGRGLPFLAVNRQFLVAFKRAATREELEEFLWQVPDARPAGFRPEDVGRR